MDADFLLIRKIEKGNEQAMDQFVLKHYPKIYPVLFAACQRSWVCRRSDTGDISEVFSGI